MSEAIPPLPQYTFMVWCSVKKHRENFTFALQIYINQLFGKFHQEENGGRNSFISYN
jgi:hypothetical protein